MHVLVSLYSCNSAPDAIGTLPTTSFGLRRSSKSEIEGQEWRFGSRGDAKA